MRHKTEELAQRMIEHVKSQFPLKSSHGMTLEINNLKAVIPEDNYDIDNQLAMKYSKKGSTEGHLKGTVTIKDKSGTVVDKSNMQLFKFPVLTDRSTFIVNGNEKNLLSQIRTKPGCYTGFSDDNDKVKTRIVHSRTKGGKFTPAITVTYTVNDSKLMVSVGKKFNASAVNFLSILGFNDGEIRNIIGHNDVADRIMAKSTRGTKTIDDLFKVLYPTGVEEGKVTPQRQRELIFDFFAKNTGFNSGGSRVIEELLNVKNAQYITKDVITKAIKKTVDVAAKLVPPDEQDDLKYKTVYNSNDLIMEAFTSALDRFIEESRTRLEASDAANKSSWIIASASDLKNSQELKSLLRSELTQSSEEINPLFIEGLSRKITQLGPGGLGKESKRGVTGARGLTQSGMNRIDPVETPESGNIGLIQNLAINAKVEDGSITVPFYKVMNGEAIMNDSNVYRLDAIEEEKHVIAFNDSKYVAIENGKIKFKTDIVPARFGGKTSNYPVNKIEYVDKSSQSVLGTAANLIPFVHHNDGARVLMGTKMQSQSVNLVGREAPLVTTLADREKGITYDEKVGNEHGKPVKSMLSGKVTKITDSAIIVEDGKGGSFKHPYYKYFPLNQSFVNNELKVKVGDNVSEGQILAEGWQTKGGKLALGVNTRIGYLPYKGYNYEDGVVVSKSYTKKMTTEETYELDFEIKKDFVGGKGSNVKKELSAYTVNSSVNKLDKDGIIKIGEYVKAGSVVVAGLKEIKKDSATLSTLDLLKLGTEDKSYRYSEMQIPSGSYVEGKVVRVTVVNNPDALHKQKIVVTIVANKTLKVGDKIAGRHGNKGTITKILDDELMPSTADGKPLELLFSPLAVPSRKNVGQIFETNAGLIAEKTGKPFVVDNFNHEEKERVLKMLKDIGCPEGKTKVLLKEEDENGKIINVPVENDVTVGSMYIMKLKHKVDDKIQARNNLGTYFTEQDNMPGKIVGSSAGEKENPQRLGEMEMRALQGHGAVWNLLESTTIKSDGGGSQDVRRAMYRAIATGKLDSEDLKRSASPETMKVLTNHLKTLNFNVKPLHNGKEVDIDKPFDSIGIVPLKGEDFVKSIGEDKEITSSGLVEARKLYGDPGKNKDNTGSVYQKGGLLDPEIFGDKEKDDPKELRDKWGYIKLATPVCNPLLLRANSSGNPYVLLTKLSNKQVTSLNSGDTAVVVDPKEYLSSVDMPAETKKMYQQQFTQNLAEHGYKVGDIVKTDVLDKLVQDGIKIPAKTGGDAIHHLLSKIDVKKELAVAEKELESAEKIDDISFNYKRVRALKMLDKNNLNATDTMVKHVPVMPTYLRPVTYDTEKRQTIVNDTNKLYMKIVDASNKVKKDSVLNEDGHVNPIMMGLKDYAVGSNAIYKSLDQLSGGLEVKDNITKNPLKAVSGSNGVLGGKEGLIRGKMLSKRTDFSGRSVIGVDPELKLNEAGLPMDMAKQLYRPFIIKELINKGVCEPTESAAEAKLNKMDDEVKQIIKDVVADRPIMLNRQPSLHKFSIQAFKPIVRDYQDGSSVRAIQLNPLVVTGFNADFDGDTMAAHVPVTEKAKEEAKELMMPSSSLVNPTDGKIVVEIRHEMALGIYQLTKTWRKPEGKPMPFANFKDLRKAYMTGKVSSSQAVQVPISPAPTTAGQAMFNWQIPEKLSQFRDFKKVWDKKSISNFIADAYREAEKDDFKKISKMDIANLLDRIKKLGFESSTRSGISIGSSDFTQLKEINGVIEKAKGKNLGIDEWIKIESQLKDKLESGVLDEDNPLQVMMQSGARASAGQILKMNGMVGIGMDVSKKIQAPITSSHFEGLSPHEYFRLGSDSRKGIYDRAVSTSEPGALTRDVWNATQDIVVSESDCKTKEFIMVKKNDNTIRGRYAGKDILNKDGKVICKKNQMIDNTMFASIHKDDTIEYVPVRSPLRCKTPHGVCQKCYGALPGTIMPVKIGTAVGVLASQAMGEPVTQMTMNTFHTGGANSSATLGLPRIKNILNVGKDKMNGAVIATKPGTVTKIESLPMETVIYVDDKPQYRINKPVGGIAPKLSVTVGSKIAPGDFLTIGSKEDIQTYIDDHKTQIVLTNADPRELFKQKTKAVGQDTAMDYTKDYLTDSMQYAVSKAVSKGSMDRRHMETIVSKLTSVATVMDAGHSPFLKGQDMDVKAIHKWNEMNCKPKSVPTNNVSEVTGKVSAADVKAPNGMTVVRKGEVVDMNMAQQLRKLGIPSIKVSLKPIQYQLDLNSQGTIGEVGHDNWFSNLGGQNINEQLTRGATLGQVDNLSDPRSRVMSGKMLNIGEGADMPKKIRTGMANNMMNFFSKTLDNSIAKARKEEKGK